MAEHSPSLVIFDGVCNLCNGSVDLVMRKSGARTFLFLPLQTPAGEYFSGKTSLASNGNRSILLWENGKLYRRSTAALRISRKMKMPYPFLSALLIVPRFIRDGVYRFIANRRYRWFGKRDTCRLPSEEEKERFITTEKEIRRYFGKE